MNKVRIEFEYCYGIKKLQHEFDFSKKNGFIIYSSNGTMKTSLAKTLRDISYNQQPKDNIFTDRISKYKVCDENYKDLSSEIYVIESLKEDFESERVATLLVDRTLKERYNKIHIDIDKKKEELLTRLKSKSGLTKGIDEEISKVYGKNSKYFLDCLEVIKNEINKENIKNYEYLPKYKEVFDEKAITDLRNSVDVNLLEKYMEKYNEMLEKSNFLKKGVFNHTNADDVGKNLSKNGFFKAEHSIILSKEIEINNQEQLEELINTEKERILTDKELKNIFEKIDKALTKNQNTKYLRELLEKYPTLVAEFRNLEHFKKDVWIFYLASEKIILNQLLELYEKGKQGIREIVSLANAQNTKWKEVIKIFNERFTVPFELKVNNQVDVILNDEAPSIGFVYKDVDESKEVEKKNLLAVLSMGEKRALYLLNVIFEIEVMKEECKEILLVVDDIADSFDYKNKYAIIEYLKDILESGFFKMIVLTHNFDFYRTVGARLGLKYNNTCMTIRSRDNLQIVKGQYLGNVFENWKDELEKCNKKLIASIPFMRNIIEYIEGEKSLNYKRLTSLLHIKDDTYLITIGDLEEIYNQVWKVSKTLNDKTKLVVNLIFEEAEKIIDNNLECINLENKIVLSIAIRLRSEMYMIKKLDNESEINHIKSNQTTELFKLFKNKYVEEIACTKLLEDVNLMTPENIHLNSFMYEPLLDLSDDYLIDLYKKIKELK